MSGQDPSGAAADTPTPRPGSCTATAHQLPDPAFRGNQWKLSAAQLFSGVGIATGFAVGGILAEQLTGRTDAAGFGQTASILGAALLAVPLARLAAARSRRIALSLGFSLAALGALLVVLAAATAVAPLFFVGMACFGAATASGFQARYAAMDTAAPHQRACAMSIVVWATTVGSVAGPNLAGLGGRLGRAVGIGELGGPFLVSLAGFALAAVATSLLRAPTTAAAPVATEPGPVATEPAPAATAPTPLARVLTRSPAALLGLLAAVVGHVLMVAVMVMTPVHMHGQGPASASSAW
ncbi:MFS transporter [Brachybacterium sp. EF45031]|uniref:MFS transporter n=1 Tax=Brachybacterium sillae TaxID=2810536 RepID=UPI00217E836B|nr:MFS transporter [Brachybacterium sillae]MCS6711817.1 MFS transporter [Brachybacterium sillae]